MIKSVSSGSTGLTNNSPRRTKTEPQLPFPKIGSHSPLTEEQITPTSAQTTMVGVKPNTRAKSIMNEEFGVFRTNADGDKLEVSKKAISMAKDRFLK